MEHHVRPRHGGRLGRGWILALLPLGGILPGPGGGAAVLPAAEVLSSLPAVRADTVLALAEGTTVEVRDFDGEIVVEGWDRPELRLEGAEPREGALRISRAEGGVTVRPGWEGGDRRDDQHLRLRLPATSPLRLRGQELEIRVRGLRAGAEIRNLEGDILMERIEGPLTVQSVDGEISGRGLRGTMRIRTVDESVDLRELRGRLELRTTDGDLVVEDAVLDDLEASTTDGDVVFDGELVPGGSYLLTTHSGDVAVSLPRQTGAEVSVSTFGGSFEADFPVRLDRLRHAGEARFTLGDGGARLVLKAFDGEIRLLERSR